MPPAFVLSQDQTLKFIPGRTRLAWLARPKQGLQTLTYAQTSGNPRRRPRIPSFSPPSQSTHPKAFPQGQTANLIAWASPVQSDGNKISSAAPSNQAERAQFGQQPIR